MEKLCDCWWAWGRGGGKGETLQWKLVKAMSNEEIYIEINVFPFKINDQFYEYYK